MNKIPRLSMDKTQFNIYIYIYIYIFKFNHVNLFSLYIINKKFNKRWEIKLEEKNKNKKILNEKKLKGMKLIIGVLGAALLCIIYSATVKNTLFEDNDGANIRIIC